MRLPRIKTVASRLLHLGVCGAMLLLLPAGCGKKAPPAAPEPRPLTAVADLKAVFDKGQVRLTWTHRPDNQYANDYVVLRAQKGLSQAECKDCPRVFQKVGTIPIPGSVRQKLQVLEFTQSLAAGFSYTFSVRPIHGSGAQGPDSNFVTFEVPDAGDGTEDGHE
ncbi:MAG: hypothetical protein P8Z73_04920 [Desulfobacteraceae bacterium]